MGKFYELFEMDAHVGAKELGLQYMKVLDLAIAGSLFMLVVSIIRWEGENLDNAFAVLKTSSICMSMYRDIDFLFLDYFCA